MNSALNDKLRSLPKIDQITKLPEWIEIVNKYGLPYAVSMCREAIESARTRILKGESQDASGLAETELQKALLTARLKPMQRIINATGIILHTNLGRAPFSKKIISDAVEILCGATNMEMDPVTGERSIRGEFVRKTLARICQAEDALIVNNNAAALLLVFSVIAQNREVIISRGELIQIGGGFRIPEVIQQGRAILREVGTTNITTLDDYRYAINPQTAAILKVHLSNFSMNGFAERPCTKELASLKTKEIPLIEDLGSGNLLGEFSGIKIKDPSPAQVLSDGADLVCFSGDKLLGGPQAGIIAGSGELIQRLEKSALMRAIRPDKITYILLQAVLSAYENGEPELVFPWKQAGQSRKDLIKRIKKFCKKHHISTSAHPVVETSGEFGSGSLPSQTIESAGILVSNHDADIISEKFRHASVPVIGIIQNDCFILDFLTVLPQDEVLLAHAFHAIMKQYGE
jgi:L-seryl-tRNA(Ser) seleniumtransferase